MGEERKLSSSSMFDELKAKNAVVQKFFVNTKKLEPTPLNGKRIQIRVLEGQMKSAGLFSANYLLYKIKVEPLGWSIHRKD